MYFVWHCNIQQNNTKPNGKQPNSVFAAPIANLRRLKNRTWNIQHMNSKHNDIQQNGNLKKKMESIC